MESEKLDREYKHTRPLYVHASFSYGHTLMHRDVTALAVAVDERVLVPPALVGAHATPANHLAAARVSRRRPRPGRLPPLLLPRGGGQPRGSRRRRPRDGRTGGGRVRGRFGRCRRRRGRRSLVDLGSRVGLVRGAHHWKTWTASSSSSSATLVSLAWMS